MSRLLAALLLGAGLSQQDVLTVVTRETQNLRSTCWAPDAGTQTNVTVTVHIVIAPSGSVQSATSQGNDPTVGKCLESVIKTWRFPSSSDETQVNIPFHFVRQ